MNLSSLSPDDLPPQRLTPYDRALRYDLEQSLERRFYEACEGVTQSLLMGCEWYFTTQPTVLTLVINCPDPLMNWRVLHNIVAIGRPLESLNSRAKIRVCPPIGKGTPFEIRVDELSIYLDSPHLDLPDS